MTWSKLPLSPKLPNSKKFKTKIYVPPPQQKEQGPSCPSTTYIFAKLAQFCFEIKTPKYKLQTVWQRLSSTKINTLSGHTDSRKCAAKITPRLSFLQHSAASSSHLTPKFDFFGSYHFEALNKADMLAAGTLAKLKYCSPSWRQLLAT